MKNLKVGPVFLPLAIIIVIGVLVVGGVAYGLGGGGTSVPVMGEEDATSTAEAPVNKTTSTPATKSAPSTQTSKPATGDVAITAPGGMTWSFKLIPNTNQSRLLVTLGNTIYGIGPQTGKCTANADTGLYPQMVSSATCSWTIQGARVDDVQKAEALYGVFKEGGKLIVKSKNVAPDSIKTDFAAVDTLEVPALYKTGTVLAGSGVASVVIGQDVQLKRANGEITHLRIADIDEDSVYVEVVDQGATRYSLNVQNGLEKGSAISDTTSLRVSVKSITGTASAVLMISLGTIVE